MLSRRMPGHIYFRSSHMKRILSVLALVVFAGPVVADDKAKIKDLEV